MPLGEFLGLVIDCDDPSGLSDFWQQLVGGERDAALYSLDWRALAGVPKIGYLGFQKVPEAKAVKNRVHVDIDIDDLRLATEKAVALGAKVHGEVIEESTNFFQVMTDPEGNEFCFILRKNNK